MASSHEEWLSRKEYGADELEYEKFEGKRKDAEDKERRKERSLKAQAQWTSRKAKLEKANTLLHTVDTEHSRNHDDWVAVGVAMCAVDVSMGLAMLGGRRPARDVGEDGDEADARVKSMKGKWVTWSRSREGDPRHVFEDVVIPNEVGATLSGSSQEAMEERARNFYQSGDPENKYVHAALTWTPAARNPPKNASEEARDRTNDILNKMWMKRVNAQWVSCHERLQNEVEKKMSNAGGGGDDDQKSGEGGEQKSGGGGGGGGGGGDGGGDGRGPADGREGDWRAVVTGRVVHKLGVGFLKAMCVQDVLDAEDQEKAKELENDKTRKEMFDGFARKKNRLKVRLPADWAGGDDGEDGATKKKGGVWKPPRFDFSRRGVCRSAKTRIPTDSLDLMRGGGMRTVHAGSKKEVEIIRKRLAEQGFVHKDNFIDIDDDRGDMEQDKYEHGEEREREQNELRESVHSSARTGLEYRDVGGWVGGYVMCVFM